MNGFMIKVINYATKALQLSCCFPSRQAKGRYHLVQSRWSTVADNIVVLQLSDTNKMQL